MPGRSADADMATVAVAGNFTQAARNLQSDFEAQTSHTLTLSFGASGALYAQIRHGAPFDVFLSADAQAPKMLETENMAVADSRFTYATGQLVLWHPQANPTDNLREVLIRQEFTRLAIAEPRTAPYGEAARQTLDGLNLWMALQPRIVRGASITQAYQFVASGHATMGFVARSQVLDTASQQGAVWLAPETLYDPPMQQAVLLKRGEGNPAAVAFLQFLQTDKVKVKIRDFGYKVD